MLQGNEVALSQGRMIEDEVQVWAGTTWKPEDLRALTALWAGVRGRGTWFGCWKYGGKGGI